MLNKIGITFLVVLLLVIVVGALLPKEFHVEKSINIDSIEEGIHPYINDLKQWPKWNPWQFKKQGIQLVYGNVTRGVGATQSWKGPSGRGKLKITASSPDNGIAFDIYLSGRDNPAISAIEYLRIDQNSTRVTWRLHGEIDMPVIGGFIALIVEYKTSEQYQTGLNNLRQIIDRKTDN